MQSIHLRSSSSPWFASSSFLFFESLYRVLPDVCLFPNDVPPSRPFLFFLVPCPRPAFFFSSSFLLFLFPTEVSIPGSHIAPKIVTTVDRCPSLVSSCFWTALFNVLFTPSAAPPRLGGYDLMPCSADHCSVGFRFCFFGSRPPSSSIAV